MAIGGVDWAIAAVTWLAIAAALAVAIRRMRRRRPADAAVDEVGDGMAADVPDLDLEGLRGEPDARRAVIASYALMERVMAGRELGRERSEAPLEYLGRMTATGFARIGALGRLTRLYARARFSTHPIDPAMKAEAVDAVAVIAAGEEGG